MAKQQRTILICDRCNVEHNTDLQSSYNIKAYPSNGPNLIDWKDLCGACSYQLEKVMKDWIIRG